MQTVKNKELAKHISFEYTSFDRVLLRGYITRLFVEGSIIRLLRNLGFNAYTNGVMRILTDKLHSHIKKTSENLGVQTHWWGENEKKMYHSKIDLIKSKYKKELSKKRKKSKVIAIIKALENTRTFSTKLITTKKGKKHNKMYAVHKFVSHYYIYIDDEELGLCYLKIASYLPFVSEFYFNGHNYLQKQFDLQGKSYTKKDNSFTKVEDIVKRHKISTKQKPL